MGAESVVGGAASGFAAGGPWGAALGALGGIIGGRSAGKLSREQRAMIAAQQRQLEQQTKISGEMYDQYKQEYGRFDSKYSPMEDEIINMSRTIARPDYEGVLRRSTSDYNTAREQNRGETQRTYQRMGIDPSNPMYMKGVGRTSVADSLALSTARNMAREAERTRTQTQGFSLRKDAYGMGSDRMRMFSGNPGTAIGGYGGAASGYSTAAGQYGEAAGGAAQMAGYGLNSVASWLDNRRPGGGGGGGWQDPYANIMNSGVQAAPGGVTITDIPRQ